MGMAGAVRMRAQMNRTSIPLQYYYGIYVGAPVSHFIFISNHELLSRDRILISETFSHCFNLIVIV